MDLGKSIGIIGVILGIILSFMLLNALFPSFMTSITTLNKTMGTYGVAGGTILFILPFILVIGVIVAGIYATVTLFKDGGFGGG